MSSNQKDFAGLVMIIAILIVIGLSAGCTVTSTEWARAEDYCKSRGGVQTVDSVNKIGVCNFGHAITVSAYND